MEKSCRFCKSDTELIETTETVLCNECAQELLRKLKELSTNNEFNVIFNSVGECDISKV